MHRPCGFDCLKPVDVSIRPQLVEHHADVCGAIELLYDTCDHRAAALCCSRSHQGGYNTQKAQDRHVVLQQVICKHVAEHVAEQWSPANLRWKSKV